MKKIAVIGSLLIDISIPTLNVPEWDENLQLTHYAMGAGGKGANAATTLSRLECQVLVVGCVGDDHLGQIEIAALQAEGVDTSGVIRIPAQKTDLAIVMVRDDGNNAVMATTTTNHLLTGPMVKTTLDLHRGFLDAILVNFECSEDAVAAAVQWARIEDIPVIVDAGPIRGFGPETWRDATVLSPNLDEMAALAGVPTSALAEDEAVSHIARDLLQYGPEVVVVKWGGRGSLLVTREYELLVPAFSVKVVDTTGSGDAFTAALTWSLAQDWPLAEAVRRANAAGALAASQFGTLEVMPSLAAVNKLLESK